MMVACVIFVAGSAVQSISSTLWLLVIGRALVGLGVGATAAVTPMYLAEIAPPRMRGTVVTTNSIALTGGQLIATLVDAAFAGSGGGWRWMLGLGAIPAMVQAIGMLALGMPESPAWLRLRGKREEAEVAAEWFAGTPRYESGDSRLPGSSPAKEHLHQDQVEV